MRDTQPKDCGKQNKASAKARRANVFGVQHYAGKQFVSYAYADKLKSELWMPGGRDRAIAVIKQGVRI